METIWFCLVAVMIAMYVVLDGFDIGAGMISLLVARGKAERRAVIQSIAPVWDGNEVWLLAGGGVLYFAFPKLYASSFQGFYLPLMMVLWLLMFRGLSIELRNHLDNPTWVPFWDFLFGMASLLLAVFFGAALGNVVRGVPLDERGDFFLPLWTNFNVGADVGILDWYTVLVGVLAALTLLMHGSLWVTLKTEGGLSERARGAGRMAWLGVAAMTVIVTLASFAIQPALRKAFEDRPWGYIFPALALAGLAGVFLWQRQPGGEVRAFLSSCLFIIGMLTSATQGVFPNVLPAVSGADRSLTIYNAAAPAYGLAIGFAWWIPGMIIAAGYFFFTYRRLAGKVKLEAAGH
jgi:cytochrome d ubiquinol oxidase subunit II